MFTKSKDINFVFFSLSRLAWEDGEKNLLDSARVLSTAGSNFTGCHKPSSHRFATTFIQDNLDEVVNVTAKRVHSNEGRFSYGFQ